jgi:hypothetical protein
VQWNDFFVSYRHDDVTVVGSSLRSACSAYNNGYSKKVERVDSDRLGKNVNYTLTLQRD